MSKLKRVGWCYQQPIFQVTVKNHQGDIETLQTTAEHPFWIKDTGWLKASLLEQGMILLDRNNQEVEVLSQFLIPNRTDTVYNIEVDDFHTYHVGRLGVWVHNADCCEVNQVVDKTKTLSPASTTPSGRISGKLMDTYGGLVEKKKLSPQQQKMVDEIMKGDKGGEKTEKLTSSILKDSGYKELAGAKYHGGIPTQPKKYHKST